MSKVLIVDDSEVARLELRNILEGGSHQVTEAEGCARALSILESVKDFDIILADYNMPDYNGIELAKRAHEVKGYEKIPYALISAQNVSSFRNEAKEAGIVATLYKPISKKAILDLVTRFVPA